MSDSNMPIDYAGDGRVDVKGDIHINTYSRWL